ncbi:MAG: hypothetical protein KME64_18575 [Scytonematopsis contorta HA4267-MV1]|nr:hypothetical protein [Scytonematopsis contorta HA4267-MV1]
MLALQRQIKVKSKFFIQKRARCSHYNDKSRLRVSFLYESEQDARTTKTTMNQG